MTSNSRDVRPDRQNKQLCRVYPLRRRLTANEGTLFFVAREAADPLGKMVRSPNRCP